MIDKFGRAAKAWFGAIVAGATALDVGLADGSLTKEEAARCAVAFLLALGTVYNVSNRVQT